MPQQSWGNQVDYILTLLGYSIGVGCIWKFPYLCARNGGGSYLIPYMFFVLICAFPLAYMEMFVGQFTKKGVIGAWNICPAVKGLAAGAALLSVLFSIYYSTFFSWILYYLYFSFSPQLPWTQCGQSWNTLDCVEDKGLPNKSKQFSLTEVYKTKPRISDHLQEYENVTPPIIMLPINSSSKSSGIPTAEEFFRNNVLEITGGLGELGSLRWPLTLGLFATYLVVYLCMIKGIRLTGKIVYVTVTCPYILGIVILIRAVTLPGSVDGILFYITPDFESLKDLSVWIEACSYALYTSGVTYGLNLKMSAHNPVSRNCYRDAFLINMTCALSHVFFGFSVFGITGHLAYKRGVTMDHYKTSGFKLGFITYPEATSYLPIPQMWSAFLFLMLFTLGIDCLIPSFEITMDVVGECLPRIAKKRWLLNAIVLLPSFLLSVPYTTQGGVYLLTLVEWFAFFPSLVVFAILECVAVGWVYGIPRMNKAMMIARGTKLAWGMDILWKFIIPAILLVIFGYSLYSYRPPQFEDYIYPAWANVIGWLISISLLIPLPVVFLYVVWKAPGDTTREKLSNVFTPQGKWDFSVTDSSTVSDIQDRELSIKPSHCV